MTQLPSRLLILCHLPWLHRMTLALSEFILWNDKYLKAERWAFSASVHSERPPEARIRLSSAKFASLRQPANESDEDFREQEKIVINAMLGKKGSPYELLSPLHEVATLPQGLKIMAHVGFARPAFLITSSLKPAKESRVKTSLVPTWSRLYSAASAWADLGGCDSYSISIFSPQIVMESTCDMYFALLDLPSADFFRLLYPRSNGLETDSESS